MGGHHGLAWVEERVGRWAGRREFVQRGQCVRRPGGEGWPCSLRNCEFTEAREDQPGHISWPAGAGPVPLLPWPPCCEQPSVLEEGKGVAGFRPAWQPRGRRGTDRICPAVVCSHTTTPRSGSTALCLTGIIAPNSLFRVNSVLSVVYRVWFTRGPESS